MRILLSLFCAITTTMPAVIIANPYEKQEQSKLDNNETDYLQANNENRVRTKRDIINLPNDAQKIVIHNMRGFDVYGSSKGAYIVRRRSNIANKIPGVDGNVVHGIIADKYFKQEYNIYFTIKHDNCSYEYYALKDGEAVAHKIIGLPDDAKLLSIHNLAGVIFFGSTAGAYELTQGNLEASKVPHVNGNVVAIRLKGGSGKYDADFITIADNYNDCKQKLELKKLENELNKANNELTNCQEEINRLKLSVAQVLGLPMSQFIGFGKVKNKTK